jgi:hypothetical protein
MTKTYLLRAPASMIFAAIGFLLAGIIIWSIVSNFYQIFIPLHIPLSLILGGIGSVWFKHIRKVNREEKWLIRYLPHLAFSIYLLWFLIIHIDLGIEVENIIFIPIIVQLVTFVMLGSATRYVINFFRWRQSPANQPKVVLSDTNLSIDYPWQGETVNLELALITHTEVREYGARGIWIAYQGDTISISEQWLSEVDYKSLIADLKQTTEVKVAKLY